MHNSVSFSLVKRLNWHIKNNADNCKVVHMGRAYPSFIYKIMTSHLTIAFQEQGFGAMIENSTKKHQLKSHNPKPQIAWRKLLEWN